MDGELPDHLIPILRYLDLTSQPLPELVDVLEPAVQRMLSGLRQAEASNPYTHLLEAYCRKKGLQTRDIRFRRSRKSR